MRFMLLMIPAGYETAAPGTMPDPEVVARMMKYNQSMQDAGIVLAADGLHPPSMGARVSFAGEQPEILQTPFPGVNEVIGGYWIINVGSKAEAVDWARRCPASHNETIEVRQLQEAADF